MPTDFCVIKQTMDSERFPACTQGHVENWSLVLGVYHAWQSAKVAMAAWPGGGGGGGGGGVP